MFERGDAEFAADGTQVRRIGLVMDITERKLAENAIRESEERFRTVFSYAATGIATTDLAGRFIDANPAYLKMLGYSLEELRSFTYKQLTYPDDLDKNVEGIEALIAGEIPNLSTEKRYLAKGGGVVWCQLEVSLQRDADGNPVGLIGIAEDVTRQVETEKALRHSRALAKFASTISRLGAWEVDSERNVTWSEETRELYEAPEGFVPSVEEGLACYAPESRYEITRAFET